MDKANLNKISKNLSKFINLMVDVKDGDSQLDLFEGENSLRLKIDILERAIETLRIEKKYIENKLPMEEFVQGSIEIVESKIKYSAPNKSKCMGSGTKPIELQPKLLLYLFYSHKNGHENVYDIINNYINIIWDHLDVLDFKKTRTGVHRCFTNTRFAAKTLREYGLLRFTQKEAYKTWVLSLPGILVASKVMETQTWDLSPVIQGKYHFDLHPDTRNAFDELQTYDKYVQRLASVCKPDTKVFIDFKEGSKRAYSLMADYWHNLQNSSISTKERKKKSVAKLKQINQDQEIKVFFINFISCLKIGDILNTNTGRMKKQ